MPLARADLDAGNHLKRRIFPLGQQVSYAFCPFNMIVVRNRDHLQIVPDRLLHYLRGTGPAIAQVCMHMDIGFTIFCFGLCIHTRALTSLKNLAFVVSILTYLPLTYAWA